MRVHVAAAGLGPKATARAEFLLGLPHASQAQPADADAILFVGIGEEDDIFVTRLRQHPLVRRFRAKVLVWDERDQPLYSFPGLYASATGAWASRHHGRILGGPYLDAIGIPSREDNGRDLLFSFRGALTHPIRRRVATLTHPHAVVETTGGFMEGDRESYFDLLARSRFALCPRGYGHSSIRIFEALRMGSVPVVISDDWLAPTGHVWERAVLRVPQREVEAIPTILDGLNPASFDVAGAALDLSVERFWATLDRWLSAARRSGIRPWWWDRRTLRAYAEVSTGRRDRIGV